MRHIHGGPSGSKSATWGNKIQSELKSIRIQEKATYEQCPDMTHAWKGEKWWIDCGDGDKSAWVIAGSFQKKGYQKGMYA